MTHTVTNTGHRRIGIPVRQAFTLDVGESREITDGEFAQMENNRTTVRWMETGILSVASQLGEAPHERSKVKQPTPKPAATPPKAEGQERLPDGITGVGVEREVFGGGWQHLWVNGFRVTDKKVRATEADAMAKDYRS